MEVSDRRVDSLFLSDFPSHLSTNTGQGISRLWAIYVYTTQSDKILQSGNGREFKGAVADTGILVKGLLNSSPVGVGWCIRGCIPVL